MSAHTDPDGIPEIRTTPRLAVLLCLGAVAAVAIAALAGSRLEDGLGSAAAAVGLLGFWCVLGWGAAIAAVVDAFTRPEGERLGLATTIAATLFVLLALVVVSGIVAGMTDLSSAGSGAGAPS